MGAEVGKLNSQMAVTSMTLTTPNIETVELTIILTELRIIAKNKNSEFVDKAELDSCLKKIEKFDAADLELFNKLFILFDMKGDGTVNFKDYMSGIFGSFITGSCMDRLKVALAVYDEKGTRLCLKGDVKRMLYAINGVASYFGDPVLSSAQLDELVHDLFQTVPKVTGQFIAHDPCLEFLVPHNSVQVFIRGLGKARFGLDPLPA